METTPAAAMRIAMVAPPWFEVPPPAYGGVETMCADLIQALMARGHDVTLIGAGRNGTPARFARTYVEPPSTRLGEPVPEVLHAAASARHLDRLDVDVVHDHSLAGPLTARARRAPTVATVHGSVAGELAEYYCQLDGAVRLVAISDAQRRLAPELSWIGTVHNGVVVDSFPYRENKDDFVLFLGRFNPDKGAHVAIDTARAASRRIVLAGKLSEAAERAYFEAEIAPRLGPDVEWVGEADARLKRELFAAARCLLFPIAWEEPFGLVMVEAMACGTPVVALGRGSVPEIVVDGVSGYVRERPEDLVAAVAAADLLSPADCRAHARERFDVGVMAVGYERVYAAAVVEREVADLARAAAGLASPNGRAGLARPRVKESPAASRLVPGCVLASDSPEAGDEAAAAR